MYNLFTTWLLAFVSHRSTFHAAEPLIRTSSPLAFRLIAYSSNAADYMLSPEGENIPQISRPL